MTAARLPELTSSRTSLKCEFVIGFDYGTQTIGVAVGTLPFGSAQGVGRVSVSAGKPNKLQLSRIMREWCPARLVVGLPLTFEGGETGLCKQIRIFGKWLEREFRLPVEYIDERLSTEEAKHRIQSQGIRKSQSGKSGELHQIAAQIILETYFCSISETSESHRGHPPSTPYNSTAKRG